MCAMIPILRNFSMGYFFIKFVVSKITDPYGYSHTSALISPTLHMASCYITRSARTPCSLPPYGACLRASSSPRRLYWRRRSAHPPISPPWISLCVHVPHLASSEWQVFDDDPRSPESAPDSLRRPRGVI